jgi:hypothetical protein
MKRAELDIRIFSDAGEMARAAAVLAVQWISVRLIAFTGTEKRNIRPQIRQISQI